MHDLKRRDASTPNWAVNRTRRLMGSSWRALARRAGTLRIGNPYRASDVDWACPVALEGLYSQLSDIHGMDSFQALMLAQRLLLQLMTEVVTNGGCFRNIEDDCVVDVSRLFSDGA